MIEINKRYYIDTDFDYGYSNSWMGHTKHYFGLYETADNRRKKIREYEDLSALCDSLLSKFNKGILEDTSYEEIKCFINCMINENKIKRKSLLK